MKKKLFLLASSIIFSTQAAQELVPATIAPSNHPAIACLQEATNIPALQHLILGYLDSWEFDAKILHKSVRSTTFSPNGMYLANGFSDGSIMIDPYKLDESNNPEGFFFEHVGVRVIAFSPDSTCLASGCLNAHINIWRQNNNKWTVVQELTDHKFRVQSIAFSPDGKYLISGSSDQTIKVWEQEHNIWRCIQTLAGHEDSINSVVFSPDGKYLASGSGDIYRHNTVKIWEKDKNNKWICTHTLADHKDFVTSVAFSPDGKYLASGSNDKTIKIWQPNQNDNNWSCIATLTSKAGLYSIAFSPNGKYLASSHTREVGKSGFEDGFVIIWRQDHQNNWTQIQELHGLIKSDVKTVAFSPDGSYLAFGADDGGTGICHLFKNQAFEIMQNNLKK